MYGAIKVRTIVRSTAGVDGFASADADSTLLVLTRIPFVLGGSIGCGVGGAVGAIVVGGGGVGAVVVGAAVVVCGGCVVVGGAAVVPGAAEVAAVAVVGVAVVESAVAGAPLVVVVLTIDVSAAVAVRGSAVVESVAFAAAVPFDWAREGSRVNANKTMRARSGVLRPCRGSVRDIAFN